MKRITAVGRWTISLALGLLAHTGRAQTASTASQQLELSAFAGVTGTFTRIAGGKNLDITGGVDLTYLPFRLLRPTLELRGTYPVDNGTLDGQRNFQGGIKVEHDFGRLRPYADFLIGRGQIDYGFGGFRVGDILYISSTSNIYSFGGGADLDLTPHVALKGDVQVQHWDSPVVISGTLYPVALTLGGVYRFDFNSHHHRRR